MASQNGIHDSVASGFQQQMDSKPSINKINSIRPPELPGNASIDQVLVSVQQLKSRYGFNDPRMTGKQWKIQLKETQAYFANERTFLNWLNPVSFFTAASVSLLLTGDPLGKVAGMILVIYTICIFMYILKKYMGRIKSLDKIHKNEYVDAQNFEDQVGSWIVVGSLCVILFFLAYFYGFHYSGPFRKH
mmetsp:Transcript_3232/g.4461  ORF Transcript_3232/g.4461 Transcript_3232/m.4461 type:complete len:189 (+) Transcript_3232:169-735(+)